MRLLLLSLLLLMPSLAFAAPPDVPKELKARPGQLIRVVAKGEGEIGFTRSFDDESAFFDELVPKPKEKRYIFQSDKAGVYFLAFWTKGETEGAVCVITVGDGKPVPVPPKPTDPPVTPPTPTSLYLLIVRPDGPAAPDYAKSMGLPEWDVLRKAGHKVKDKTLTEATRIGMLPPPGTKLPAVVILREDADGSVIVGNAAFPASASEILDLPKKVVVK